MDPQNAGKNGVPVESASRTLKETQRSKNKSSVALSVMLFAIIVFSVTLVVLYYMDISSRQKSEALTASAHQNYINR